MMSKANHKRNRRKRPAWVEMFARTSKVEARTSDGRDWHTDIPNIKLSRAFVVVLILHVVAVGGILAFEMFKPKRADDSLANTGAIEKVSADEPAAAREPVEDTPPTPPAVLREERDGGYERYIVQQGDSIRDIADYYQISRTELLAINRIDEMHPLVQGRILRIPKSHLAAVRANRSEVVSTGADSEPRLPTTTTSVPVPGAPGPVVTPPADDLGISSSDGLASDTPGPSVPPAPDRPAPAGDDGFRPLSAMPGGESARPEIVAPQPDPTTPSPATGRPRVVRELPRTTTTRPPAPEPSAGGSHTIAPGDTLYRISRKHGVSVDAILAANPGTNPRTLRIGQTLRIP